MKLTSFAVQNYRSITQTRKLSIGDFTVLIGPNNEGKSNILRAIVTVLGIVAGLSEITIYRGRLARLGPYSRRPYDWDRDFPISLQRKHPNGESVFNLVFKLTAGEVNEFWEGVKSNIDGILPVQITIGRNEPTFKVAKKGPGGKALSQKAEAIARFIGKRFEFQYIPTVRTAEMAADIVREMVAKELKVVETDPIYQTALKELAKLQAPVLNKLSETITDTLKSFLPNIKNVVLKQTDEAAYRALHRSVDIVVDDGTPTSLERKGDGVQSLAALGLMRHASQTGASQRSLVLAIEEPESHLHPRAIHQLKDVLLEISKKNQIIITTHCPLFVNRAAIESNILVSDNKAVSARNAGEIRTSLGVRASDNLRNAELVLIVEGEEDRVALATLLPEISPQLQEALRGQVLTIDSLQGASNLGYKLSQLRDALCLTNALMDNDDAGKKAFAKARTEGLITEADVTFTVCQGMVDSEIEDVYDPSVYASTLLNRYGVTLDCPPFKSSKKWSIRMRETFEKHGKLWDDRYEMQVKQLVAEAVSSQPGNAVNPYRRAWLDALILALVDKIKGLPPSTGRRPSAHP